MNEVTSAEALTREVNSGHSLVYAQASSLDTLFPHALRWTHQYDAPNVFLSDGPIVRSWPNCHRVWTLGAEEFVTGSAVMPSPLSVVSERGLKEIRLYNGQHLFRRFLPGGVKEFHQTLVLDGTVQKNIVLVAEDLPAAMRNDIAAWASCVAGAVTEGEYLGMIRDAGFDQVEIVDRLDYVEPSEEQPYKLASIRVKGIKKGET